jgi:integrase/recombinase XerD
MAKRPTNTELVQECLLHLQKDLGRSPLTVNKYGYSYAALLEHLGRKSLLDCDHEDLQEWRRRPRGGRSTCPPAPATLKREVMELRTLYKWLHSWKGLVASNPAARLTAPTVHNENPHPAPEGEWKRLWASDLSDSDRVAFGLGYFCGLRRHEATLLTAANFRDVPHPELVGFKRKGGARGSLRWRGCLDVYGLRRPDLIGGDVRTFTEPLERLRAQAAEDGGPLLVGWRPRGVAWNARLGKPETMIDPRRYNRSLAIAQETAGLPRNCFTPHALRHSFCTNLLAMGVDLVKVSRLAGHTSITITQRYLWTSEDPMDDLLGRSSAPRPSEDEGPDEGLVIPSPWG